MTGPNRGDTWRCPYCGCAIPLIQIGVGELMPVQAAIITAYEPVANLTDHRGRPLPITDVPAMFASQSFRPVTVAVAHSSVCDMAARAANAPCPPLGHVAAPPPPPCADCGHPWFAHHATSGLERIPGQCRVQEITRDGEMIGDRCPCMEYREPKPPLRVVG